MTTEEITHLLEYGRKQIERLDLIVDELRADRARLTKELIATKDMLYKEMETKNNYKSELEKLKGNK